MIRGALVLPGRGSYTERSLGQLDPQDPWVRHAESRRKELELEPLANLDGATRFEPARHLRPANVSPLIYLRSMLDARRAAETYSLCCVLGNSMGWYTALAAAGALSFEDGFELVQQMSLLQEQGEPGGQMIYPLVDEDWQPVPERAAALQQVLDEGRGALWPSIHLGGYAVLAGSLKGLAALTGAVPKVKQGRVDYPFKLALHGPYHTPLANSVADEAQRRLASLRFARPRITLIDGGGRRHSPFSASVAELRAYTLGSQVTDPYDFTASVRVALAEFAPERVIAAGPGNSLGGVIGQILVAQRWRGVDSRVAFQRIQEGTAPVLDSLDR